MAAQTKAMFSFGSDHPADLLVNAACVTRFLSEAVGQLSCDSGEPGLSGDGANGLVYILYAVENTINEALVKL